jgi:hypothetical protein
MIDWSSVDGGYSVLMSQKMISFLTNSVREGNNLIQTYAPFYVNEPTKLCLQAVPISSWKLTPEWKDVKCVRVTDWMKVSPCAIGSSSKIFLRYKSNVHVGGFASYLWNLVGGNISLEMHKTFAKELRKVMGDMPVICHNEDVDWFHVKAQQEEE